MINLPQVFQHVTSWPTSEHLQKSLDILCGSRGAAELGKPLVLERGEAGKMSFHLCPMLPCDGIEGQSHLLSVNHLWPPPSPGSADSGAWCSVRSGACICPGTWEMCESHPYFPVGSLCQCPEVGIKTDTLYFRWQIPFHCTFHLIASLFLHHKKTTRISWQRVYSNLYWS